MYQSLLSIGILSLNTITVKFPPGKYLMTALKLKIHRWKPEYIIMRSWSVLFSVGGPL